MKILTIRGENLASLERFEVEMESGPLANVGIFAITGPTGAGKTTLLDALCVALFDRTPRLSNVAGVPVGTADQEDGHRIRANDVRGLLRRGAGSGFSEVDFVGRDGRSYRARWSVHRSRGRASGKLQNSELSLHDLETGQALGGKKRETLDAIEATLGLSFEQFRRSALLAQNDFAAFLKADKELRSDLLERMTGTEIYTKVSIAAFRRAADEAKALSALEESADSSAILEEEARLALETRRTALRALHKEKQATSRLVEASVRWFTDMRAAEASRVQAATANEEAATRVATVGAVAQNIAKVRQARESRGLVDATEVAKAAVQEALALRTLAETELAKARVRVTECGVLVEAKKQAVVTARSRHVKEIDSEKLQLNSQILALEEWLGTHAKLAALGGEGAEFAALEPDELDAREPVLAQQVKDAETVAKEARARVQGQEAALQKAKAAYEELPSLDDAALVSLRESHRSTAAQHAALH